MFNSFERIIEVWRRSTSAQKGEVALLVALICIFQAAREEGTARVLTHMCVGALLFFYALAALFAR